MTKSLKRVFINKKAFHDYKILEKFEAGIILTGAEIKAVRKGAVSLIGSQARILNGELWLLNCHIGGIEEPERTRKLLMHKQEIKKLYGKAQIKGLYLIPTKMYFKRGLAKLELALGRVKKLYDKREIIKKRDLDRQLKIEN